MSAGTRRPSRRTHRGEGALLATLRSHHPYTAYHSQRVAGLAMKVARALGFGPAQMRELRLVAALHDVGKIDVPAEILNGTGRLTDEQFAAIKRHSAAGERRILRAGLPAAVALAVRCVHERLDGTGYPDGRRGEQIPLAARIVAVCDCFDAVHAPGRSYQQPRSIAEAFTILHADAGSHFDGRIVDALRNVLGVKAPARTDEATAPGA